MRRLVALIGVLAVVAPAAAVGQSQHARLWIADRSPVVVRGSGFKSHERVTVTVRLSKPYIARRIASATGTFTVTLTGTTDKVGCNALSVRAVGSRGTIAVAKVPGIECPPPPANPTM